MLIGIAGPSASGKTTIAKLLVDEYGAIRLRYSEILSEIAHNRNLNANDKETLQDLFTNIRKERGEQWLAEALKQRAKKVIAPHLVIEGNRRLVDFETLKEISTQRGEPLMFVFIDASPETRFQRYNSNPHEHGYRPVTREEFDELERDAAEDEIGKLREIAQKTGIYIDTTDYDSATTWRAVRTALGLD